jgi:hypothetical protein
MKQGTLVKMADNLHCGIFVLWVYYGADAVNISLLYNTFAILREIKLSPSTVD